MAKRNFNKNRRFQDFKVKTEKKSCPFCTNQNLEIDYKNALLLNQFISGQAKIKKTRRTGVCAKHQRQLAKAIKRARNMSILPAASVHNFFNIEAKQVDKQKKIEIREKSVAE